MISVQSGDHFILSKAKDLIPEYAKYLYDQLTQTD